MRILVVRVDTELHGWIKTDLPSWGYDVDVIEDEAGAWKIFQVEKFDVILLDADVPGIEATHLIQKIKTSSNPAFIIALISVDMQNTPLSSAQLQADDTLYKPLISAELEVRLRMAGRIIKLEQELSKQNSNLEDANSQMKNDLATAAKIQRSFLPHTPPTFPDIEFQWGLLPCEELAGDALNVITLDETHVGFYLLDVSGHGVAAALMAMTLIHLLSADRSHSALFEMSGAEDSQFRILPPATVVERLNGQFPMDDINGQYFTCIYGILDRSSLRLSYASAGHPGPIHLSGSGESRSYPSTGMPIGFVPNSIYEEKHIDLQQGDRVYFYSDGIPEVSNKYDELFGFERLTRTLENQQKSGFSLRQSVDNLAVAALKWNDLETLSDDVSVIGLQIGPPASSQG